MEEVKTLEKKKKHSKLTSEQYDLYSPSIYGNILSIIDKAPIADKIFEKVFVSAYTDNETFPLRSPLMSLIDIAQEKSNKTLKALTIFNECCAGSSVTIKDKT